MCLIWPGLGLAECLLLRHSCANLGWVSYRKLNDREYCLEHSLSVVTVVVADRSPDVARERERERERDLVGQQWEEG